MPCPYRLWLCHCERASASVAISLAMTIRMSLRASASERGNLPHCDKGRTGDGFATLAMTGGRAGDGFATLAMTGGACGRWLRPYRLAMAISVSLRASASERGNLPHRGGDGFASLAMTGGACGGWLRFARHDSNPGLGIIDTHSGRGEIFFTPTRHAMTQAHVR